jgi:hypothetical protein
MIVSTAGEFFWLLHVPSTTLSGLRTPITTEGSSGKPATVLRNSDLSIADSSAR